MVEVQDIIKKYGKEYKEKHRILPHIAKTMGAIEKWIGYNKLDKKDKDMLK